MVQVILTTHSILGKVPQYHHGHRTQSKTQACVDDGLQQAVRASLLLEQLLQVSSTDPRGLAQIVGQQAWQVGQQLRTMRITVLVFSTFVLTYAIYMQGTSIYEMVSGAYQVTLVGAFIPLVFGLYWKRATTQGAIFAIVLGLVTWLLFMVTPAGEAFPGQLAGLLASLVGMLVGSLGPQAIPNAHASHHKLAGL